MKEGPLTELEIDELRNAYQAVEADNERLRGVLLHITELHDARSELYTNDADCAANMADHARKAIAKSP